MLEVERHIAIVNKLTKDKTVTVNELAAMLDVAKTTIRKDLTELEKSGVLTRIHGGAVLKDEYLVQTDYDEKKMQDFDRKVLIAQKALNLIPDNASIALNTSTITSLIAEYLPNNQYTVVTNSLDILNILAKKDNINLISSGGNFITKHRSFEGPVAVGGFANFSYNVSFIGANGIHHEQGISTKTFLEAEAKKTILRNSIASYVVAEEKKFDRIGLIKVSDFSDITGIVTDSPMENDKLKKYQEKTEIIFPNIVSAEVN
ncbi:DeoR/GlpR family DNA-binding transcription regulator [Vagococcus elongatus]|uniref:HTH deoR-type domain-containing protein n=1 Tax=Vagococcus elongatus TaxID=180344 RepID=A0A430AYC2_9ENTE|nr:DeoR/GlpR family DNA-binding transcription regulator [Vagococcus elongatus]RSU13035.1 hypothetical protein CBF29_05030 [Vagococcus elongatus]